MFDVMAMFERQARWQHSRTKLSWTEKLRLAEILREAALIMGSKRSTKSRPEQKIMEKQRDEANPLVV